MKKGKIDYDLRSLGIADHYCGEEFMYLALEIMASDPQSVKMISKRIYPVIARQCHTSPACVERNLRTFASKLWNVDGHVYLKRLAGRPLEKCPTNREFLDIVYAYLQQDSIAE